MVILSPRTSSATASRAPESEQRKRSRSYAEQHRDEAVRRSQAIGVRRHDHAAAEALVAVGVVRLGGGLRRRPAIARLRDRRRRMQKELLEFLVAAQRPQILV